MYEATLPVVDSDALRTVFGPQDQHLKQLTGSLPVSVVARNGKIHVRGEENAVTQATEVLERLQTLAVRKGTLSPDEVNNMISVVTTGVELPKVPVINVMQRGNEIRPRTAGQVRYTEALRESDVVFCVGPAGTGKTYLAVAMAVESFRQEKVRKIVLCRPAVEAGESLGFLPGDMYAKINPYLRPLMDALREMMDHDQVMRYIEQDAIEVIPLAYMRGRTLNDAFIILDEAQNTTVGQMKMFLTRMGFSSKIVVSGDITQVDLPPHTKSGLTDAIARLRQIEGIDYVELTNKDIVRHRLVNEIVRAYEQGSKKRK